MSEGEGRPIGRRIVLGSIGLGALGVLVGARIQSTTARWLLPVTLHDPTGLSDLIPAAGRFRIYSVTGSLPHRSDDEYRLLVDGAVGRSVTLTLARPARRAAADGAAQGLPVRDRLARRGRRLGGRAPA